MGREEKYLSPKTMRIKITWLPVLVSLEIYEEGRPNEEIPKMANISLADII